MRLADFPDLIRFVSGLVQCSGQEKQASCKQVPFATCILLALSLELKSQVSQVVKGNLQDIAAQQ